MKVSDYRRLLNGNRSGKYNSKKIKTSDGDFDSKKEHNRYNELKLLERKGIIKGLVRQPVFELQEHFKHKGKMIRAITYKADFEYYEANKHIVEDVKSVATEKDKVYRLKRKMFLYKYGDQIEFREYI